MSNQSAIELRRQLTLQKVDPEVHERVVSMAIHLRGDLMETYNDNQLRYVVQKSLQIYLPKDGKAVSNIMELLLPDHYKLKYSDSPTYTNHYQGNTYNKNNTH